MIKADNPNKIVEATEEINDSKDTSMIDAVIYKPDDPRITNLLHYKGMSVYQVKMNTLVHLTGLKPLHAITWEVDTSIIRFFLKNRNRKL